MHHFKFNVLEQVSKTEVPFLGPLGLVLDAIILGGMFVMASAGVGLVTGWASYVFS